MMLNMKLTTSAEKFILHWSEMGPAWGINRSAAQIHALLFYHGTALSAEEIAQTLNMARSNVSTSLKQLQGWGVIKVSRVLGDRRDYFEATTDLWELFKVVLNERVKRELEPTQKVLRDLEQDEDFSHESKQTKQRVHEALQMMEIFSSWAYEMQNLSSGNLKRILKMGASVQKLIHGNKRNKDDSA